MAQIIRSKSDGRALELTRREGSPLSRLRNDETSTSGGTDFALSNVVTDAGAPGSLAKSISAQIKSPHGRPSIIASNLASARGIPSSQRGRSQPVSPTLSAQQAGGKPSRLEDGRLLPEAQLRGSTSGQKTLSLHKSRRTRSPNKPMANEESRALKKEYSGASNAKQRPSSYSSEESFQRFFLTFDTLFSKLSAPLAFAGLPLKVSDDRVDSKTTMKEKENTLKNAATEPDVNQYFSKSTLRALRDEHGSKSPFGPGESFYVVPTTGGTHSYAGILARSKEDYDQKPPKPLDNVVEESEDGSGSFDHFVDASEVPSPSSTRIIRSRPGVRKHNSSSLSGASRVVAGGKTMEELDLENAALRQLLDTQSRRLQMWEASAQSQSQALAQSFRALHEYPPVHAPSAAPTVSETTADGDQDTDAAAATATAAVNAAEERIRKLEGEVKNAQQEMDACAAENAKFAKENEKLKVVIGRYREKWEQLKAGAKLRRENTVSNAGEARNDGLIGGSEGE